MKRRIHEFRALYRAWAPHLGRRASRRYSINNNTMRDGSF